MNESFRIAPDVERALRAGEPVVALESTVIAQGLPRPRNLEVGRALESEVREAGAVPATVAVIDGVPAIGVTAGDLERIALADGIVKLSTRDLPVAVARGATGATTVAATVRLASSAGVRVFATGGIGGVHRGAPPDVSADLIELRDSPMVVVCSGAKSILDLPATREALETLGVTVLGWRTDRFPAFYTRGDGLDVDARVEDAAEVAAIWRAHRSSRGRGAILLCVPVPEEHALPEHVVTGAIESALRTAMGAGIRGKDVTPYLLAEIARVTGGASLETNVALLRRNAGVAAAVASEIAEG